MRNYHLIIIIPEEEEKKLKFQKSDDRLQKFITSEIY